MTQDSAKKDKKVPLSAQRQAARLGAVQSIYQMRQNEQSAESVIKEYLDIRSGMEVDGDTFIPVEAALLSKIVQNVAKNEQDIGEVLFNALKKEGKPPKEIESLLKSILYSGICELMYHTETDMPIIINDYVEISKAFYDTSEKNLVNAVLDRVGKTVRA